MKKVLCYLGIIILLGLTFLPPVLRMFLPDKDEIKEEVILKHQLLSCESDRFITRTSYENGSIQMIVIKRFLQSENLEGETETSEDIPTLELDVIIDDLKDESTLTYNLLEDGDVLGIDFSLDNHGKLDLSQITKTIDEQKTYYESQNLTCRITEQ